MRLDEQFSITRVFTKDDAVSFSNLTGDSNRIHISETYAKTTRFKRCVVHGALLNSMFSAILGSHFPGEGTIYCSQETKFLKPVFLGDKVKATVTVVNVISSKKRATLKTNLECNAEVVATGEAVIIYP